jgi:hypothetical protein
MSSYGRGRGRRTPARLEPPGVAWSLLVIAAALVGGLAGADLEHTSLVITVIVSVAAGAIAVFAVARWPGQPAELTDGRPEGLERGLQRRPPADSAAPTQPYPARQSPEPSPGAGYTRVDPRYRAPQREYAEPGTATRTRSAVELIPFRSPRDADQGARNWWRAAAAPPPSPEDRGAPAPDLSTYLDPAVTARLDSAVIAQCPRCGAFELDIDRDRDPWAFGCQACDHTWTWRPGTPWPAVRVAPRLRKEWLPPSP